MMRLIKHGLMFGNLFAVNTSAMVERYNRALNHLIGKTTTLTDFHIDISGFSPEIGDEFDDMLYLNPSGCNRQFILLSTEQKTAPLINAKFSTSRGILRQFFDSNEAQLFALTTRDAVAGELINSVYTVDQPARLFDIRKISIEADTTESHVADGDVLREKIDQFLTKEDAWWDDVLAAEMIELAKKTGDITRQPVRLGNKLFEQGNFYTSHFGGLYVFRDLKTPAAISVAPRDALGKLPVEMVFDFRHRNDIAGFLELNGLVEPIVKAKDLNSAALLRQRMDFILIDVASDYGEDLDKTDRRGMRDLARRHISRLPEEFHALNSLLQWVENNGSWPRITSEHPAYFYTLRASQHENRDLVNRLLAQLAPLDVRQLFICHKEAFYEAYQSWPEPKREFVAGFLAQEYAVDKAGARAALFGPEPGMEEMTEQPAIVGPWGTRTGGT